MIDVVTVGAGGGSIAWISPEGTLKVGPRRPAPTPGPLCYGQGRHRADDHRRARRARPDPAAPARRRDPARRRRGPRRPRGPRRQARAWRWSECATGILEISAWNQANALRQVTVKRGLDVRDFTLATFGGSGSLLAVPAGRHPRPAPVSSCRRTRATSRRSACSPSTSSNDYVQTAVAKHADLDHALGRTRRSPSCRRRPRQALDRRGLRPRPTHRYVRTADLRYFGQAFEVRVAGARRARSTTAARRRRRRRVPRRARAPLRLRLPRRPAAAGRVGQPAGHRRRPDRPAGAARDRRRRGRRRRSGPAPATRRSASTDWATSTTGVYWRPDLAPATCVAGPAVVEEFGSTVPLHPGFTAARRRVRQPRDHRRTRVTAVTSPVRPWASTRSCSEIVEGTLAAIEKEVETAIGAHRRARR